MENTDPNLNGGQQTAVTFDDAQKDAISKIIEDRLSRQNKKHADELAAEKAAREAAELALNAEKEKSGKKKDDNSESAAEKEQFKAILEGEKNVTKREREERLKAEEQIKSLTQENRRIQKDVAIRQAIGEQEGFSFHDVNVVKTLTERHIHFDDETGTFVVKDDAGVVRQNNSLQPMTPKEFFKEFAEQHPYLVTSSAKSGSGAGESSRSGTGAARVLAKADLRTVKEKSDYIAKFGYDAYEKLPLK